MVTVALHTKPPLTALLQVVLQHLITIKQEKPPFETQKCVNAFTELSPKTLYQTVQY